jgi:3',5'-cyclic AMP phosphodiesterase CpdA
MKTAHISDLHIEINHKPENLRKAIKLIEYIKDNNYDHIIITGDITDNADFGSYEAVRKLLKKAGYMNKDKLTVTIGNHDIYGGVMFAEDILNFPKRCIMTQFKNKVKEFWYYFQESFEGTNTINGNIFPFVKQTDEFIFCGLNSIAEYSYFKNPFASNGHITSKQINELEELINKYNNKGKQLIALTHHHFNKDSIEINNEMRLWKVIEHQTMKLKKNKKSIKRLKNIGIDAVLHGHYHKNIHYKRKGIDFYNGGGAILEDKNTLRLNEIEINQSGIKYYNVTLLDSNEELNYKTNKIEAMHNKAEKDIFSLAI